MVKQPIQNKMPPWSPLPEAFLPVCRIGGAEEGDTYYTRKEVDKNDI